MKNILLMAGVMICFNLPNRVIGATDSGNTFLTGKITDKQTGEDLPGVNIYFPDLKTGAVTDVDGVYKIDNLPKSILQVQVSMIGYKLISKKIDLNSITKMDFQLEPTINEINEIVVTGVAHAVEKNRTPTPISTIPTLTLLQNSSSNIIDALARQPGVSQVPTGSGISKPVIRGLGYNRVVTVNDGIRQEGQQWGDEHGIEVDEFGVSKVEILKGPASLAYGSDAIAGVINLLSAPTLPDGTENVNLLGNYQTNNGLAGFSGNFAGNKKGFIWDVRYSNKMAHSYQNKYDGYVLNSGFSENTIGGIIGLNRSWGYSHLHFSAYSMQPGIVEGERDSASGKFIKPVAINDSTADVAIASGNDFTNYHELVPYQKIRHYKAVLNNSFVLDNGSLKTTIGWQQNRRQEFADILNPDQYGLYFYMNTVNYDVRYIFPEIKSYHFTGGINGMWQSSLNKGSEYLVPEYHLFDAGAFLIGQKTVDKLDVSGGLRFDTRNQVGKDLFLNSDGQKTETQDSASYHQFTAFNSTFSSFSGSLGLTYQFNDTYYVKMNASSGFRAPNIAELGANGVHEGTIRYEIGNPGLKSEQSIQFDFAAGMNSKHISAELDLFSNCINNFIFSQRLISVTGNDSIIDGYSAFKFVSGDANLLGGEFTIDIHPHPLDWLHFENTFSYVQATQRNQPDSTRYLPFTPAPKITSELRAVKKTMGKWLSNAYVKVGVESYMEQDKIYSAYHTETKTPGYTLLFGGIGADVTRNKQTLFSIFISGENLTDEAYQSHLSRLKYGAENYVTGRTGVYNMGRNISFKIIVPLDFTRK